ncbi:MAG: bifunctional pyr operon transcriptional regulator/uracil phosphoribosyltransferase PyrR [Bacteroidia bacterium]|nr:bifunctional pyr operon transcriptional regulator/uracil phosphoribosyltransferase PyrR [Bacteroidia bacterium]MDW8236701.1 bifunctional pyr operon transcriptional regulator/uracil phosphoribosyltransferase PyrR [Bacteroidia bacterium]
MQRTIAEGDRIALTLRRLAWEMVEKTQDFAIIGIELRGVVLAKVLHAEIERILAKPVPFGTLDITLERDDLHYREKLHMPRPFSLSFSVEGKVVWLVDDVIYTGRTARAAIEVLREYGRAARIGLAVLVERRGMREVPISPDCRGFVLDTTPAERVIVSLHPQPVIQILAV